MELNYPEFSQCNSRRDCAWINQGYQDNSMKKTPTHQQEQVQLQSGLCPLAHRTPIPHSICQATSLFVGRGSLGSVDAHPCCTGAHNPQLHPGRCTGICSCSGRTLHFCTPCLRIHRGHRPLLPKEEKSCS